MTDSKILNISSIYDYWQINTNEFVISIYNPFMIEGRNNKLMSIDKEKIDIIIGGIITNVIFQEGKQLMFELDNYKKLYILLKDEDYSRPEALCLNYKSGEIIVVQ